jgi:zinc protease
MTPRLETAHMKPSTDRAGLFPARSTLSNGVVVLAKETRAIPAVTINLAVRAGSVCDPPDASGAMHLLSRVIDRGTSTRSATDIAEAVDSRGIAMTVAVSRHLLSIVCTCLTEDFEGMLTLLADILIHPSFPEAEIATRRAEVITAIRQDEDNPGVRAVESLMALLYPDKHPYGRPVKGSIDAVERLTREHLAALHVERFAPSELSVIVVGDVSVERATLVADQAFGQWTAPSRLPVDLLPVVPAVARRRLVIPMMSKAQADIAYGFTAISRNDHAYYAFWLMNHVLGQYSIGGRLGDSIRERQGMAYYVFSSLDANVVEGPLTIRAGVSASNVDRAVASIDGEVARLVRDGVTTKELNESRQYLIGSMPRALETNAGMSTFLQTVEFFGLGLDYDLRLPDLLHAVTVDDVHAAARRSLNPDRATIVIAGPYQEGKAV